MAREAIGWQVLQHGVKVLLGATGAKRVDHVQDHDAGAHRLAKLAHATRPSTATRTVADRGWMRIMRAASPSSDRSVEPAASRFMSRTAPLPPLTAFASSLRSKLETLAWYAARPAMYREAARRIMAGHFTTTRSVESAAHARKEGQAWCETVAVETSELFVELGVSPVTLEPVENAERDAWSRAADAAKRAPGLGGPRPPVPADQR